MRNLVHFIFTEKNFVIDIGQETTDKKVIEQLAQFESDKWQELYDLSFEQKPDWMDAAGGFLYQLAGEFQQCLTRNPDMEFLRENAKLTEVEEACERLLSSVPFSLGSEYVTEEWIKNSFDNLLFVFSQEIKEFDGSVSLYLSGKSQQLKVPERIFFSHSGK
jgi:non-specific serine/threonine protein kinase